MRQRENRSQGNGQLVRYNLRRVILASLTFIPVLLVLMFVANHIPVPDDLIPLFYAFTGTFLGLSVLFCVLAAYAASTGDIWMQRLVIYAFWILTAAFFFGMSYLEYTGFGTVFSYAIMLGVFAICPVWNMYEFTVMSMTLTVCGLLCSQLVGVKPYQTMLLVLLQLCFCAASRALSCQQIRSLKLTQKLISMAKRYGEDPLTGLCNRRGLERNLDIILPYCIRNRNLVAVIMIDIDFFKKYNDAFGHPQGDKCLCAVADCIKRSARRSTDITCRIGGEEFLVFVHGTDEKEPVMLAEKIRRNIEALQIKHSPELTRSIVTVSIGVASRVPLNRDSFHELYAAADQSLYYAKASGRNAVCCGKRVFGQNAVAE